MSEPLLDLSKPQQPMFPQIAVNFTPQGMTISIILAPGCVLSQTLGEDSMNQIVAEWIKTRQSVRRDMETVQAVMKSRVN